MSGASQEGPVQGLQDPGSRGGQGKKPPKEKKKGGKKIGRPFFAPFMAEKQTNGIKSPETPDQEKDPVIDHSVTPSDTSILAERERKAKRQDGTGVHGPDRSRLAGLMQPERQSTGFLGETDEEGILQVTLYG
uniref:Uncharacterized protein n=1 Tax=Leptospirillum ferrodiazotrophum TaxID=412449 RepID=C6HZA8_9BACT|nr:MAG: hypothetical protein UBAL3_94530084 [Leptospirillum ferrodiazotrophum]